MKAGAWSTLMATALLSACGGGSSGGGGGGSSCTPGQTATLGITATGFSPLNVCVLPGGTVSFANRDAVPHQIDASSTVTACPSLNLAPIPAGQATPVTFQNVANCTFHDDAHATDPAYEGIVAVSNATVSGGGY